MPRVQYLLIHLLFTSSLHLCVCVCVCVCVFECVCVCACVFECEGGSSHMLG